MLKINMFCLHASCSTLISKRFQRFSRIASEIVYDCSVSLWWFVDVVWLLFFLDKYTTQDVRFEWREVAPWRGIGPVGSEQRSQFRLPKYVVTFVTDKSNHIRNFGEGKCIFIALRLSLRVTNYIPTNADALLLYAGMSPELLGADDHNGSLLNKF